MKKKVIIVGAAGRDFHNYLVFFKNHPNYEVIAFTQAQIPGIAKRKFPKALAGKKAISMYPESKLPDLIKKHNIDYVCLAYSDLPHQEVMEKASIALANGANFLLLGTKDTQVNSKKPVISITAVRTGSGKSQTSRAVAEILRSKNKKVVAIRHSMPYSKNLTKQRVQRFATAEDFKKHKTTIEEEEEYQPWVEHGFVVYAGVDYQAILKQAEKEADIIIWDGGNNDMPFYKPDLNIVVADPHRAGHELTYYPGFVNFQAADIIVVNKVDSARKQDIELVVNNIKKYNKKSKIIKARSELVIEEPALMKNKSVLVVGDGPTLSHGGMSFGAGTIAAKKYKARMINPRKYAVGSIKELYNKFPHLQNELPAMGYGRKQKKELQKTINKTKCDLVLDGTPANLKKILKINKPIIEIKYELGKKAIKELEKHLKKFL
tara:strand:+ start:758 stop:2059 length:1302 start_codon:yes stop_codon:yes gene_type:complete